MSGNFAAAEIVWGVPANTITLLELMKDILGVTDNSRDTELSLHLQAGGDACERYIDNKLALQNVIEQEPYQRNPITLRYWPFVDLTSITIDGEDVTSDWEVIRTTGVGWVVKDRCARSRGSCVEQVEIAYSAGYDPLPADVGYAIVMAGIAYESEQGGVSGSVKRESVVGVGTIEYSTGDDAVSGVGALSPTVIGSLEPYRRYNV